MTSIIFFSSSVHLSAFYFAVEYYSMTYILFSLSIGQLIGFYFLAVVSRATMNMDVQIVIYQVLLVYARTGISGSHSGSIFSFKKHFQF